MTVEVEAETHPLDTLRRLADYVLGSDVQEDADRDQVMSSIWGDLQVVIDRIKDTCFCAHNAQMYCHASRCHGGVDLEPGEWKDTTWGHVLAGDQVLGADDLPWEVLMGFSAENTRSVTVVNAEGKDFTFYPAIDQPVKARRGSKAHAVEILRTRFNVEALTNGSKR